MKRSSYREALEKYAEFVKLSKELSKISTDAPITLSLEAFRIQEPDSAALRQLYTELDFTSLIKELAPVADERTTDYSALDSPAALKSFLDAIPHGQETAVWLSLDSEEPDEEGFGTRVLGIEVATKAGSAHFVANDVGNKMLGVMHESDSRRRLDPGNSARHNPLFLSAAPHDRESHVRRSCIAPFESHAFRRPRRACRFSAAPCSGAARRSRKTGPHELV